ncbi:hypothetical protein G0U57_018914 [Chelydra serpentina]|uniref:Uncharacterized protein n=1 Tax=Chelydra serpentina TaxID=8475 RepID=A0A8T1RVZ8_CHESE|nr:hypothetical protein G0U57_018914 [Chelydra serpentina]
MRAAWQEGWGLCTAGGVGVTRAPRGTAGLTPRLAPQLFANRAAVARLLGPEEQRLWRGVTEELMSDEEDSPSEPGVWVARPPCFRAAPLTQFCYRLDINAKHGAKANRVYGPPSERLPSAEAQLLPPHLYDPRFQERESGGGSSPLPHKAFCPDLRPFLEIKVEKDE